MSEDGDKKIGRAADILTIILGIIALSGIIWAYVKNYFQWAILIVIILILGLQIFIHISKHSVRINKRIEKKPRFSFNKRLFAGIFIIFSLLLLNVVQLLPSSNQFIQSFFWPTKASTIFYLSPLTNTPLPENTQTFTQTVTVSSTPTITHTNTITPTPDPFADYKFKGNCIPKGWKPLSKVFDYDKNGCLLNTGFGATVEDDVLIFNATPLLSGNIENLLITKGISDSNHYHLNGIFMNIPENAKKMTFVMTISESISKNAGVENKFFFGTLKDNPIINYSNDFGYFTVSKIQISDERPFGKVCTSPNPIVDYDSFKKYGYITPEKENGVQKIIENKVDISLSKNSYSISIDGITTPANNNRPFLSTNRLFTFGFAVPLESTLVVRISNFDIQ